METQKRGISQITGKTEIKLGEKALYKVSRIYRMEDHDKVKNALWKIYVKENGSWRELKSNPSAPPKKGDEVSYTITNQRLVGKELLIEAYIYRPEMKIPPGLKIKVVAGDKKKIHQVKLFMADDTPITENTVLKYNQSIKVKVYTQNMPKEFLKLTLYEDDATGAGHNPKNEKNKVAEITKLTNANGFLWHEFKLNADFSKIANAMMDGSSDKLHEYYVLVESEKYGKKASKNTEIDNPDYIVHQTYENGKVTDHKKVYGETLIEEVIIKGKYKKQMGINPIANTGRSLSVVGSNNTTEKNNNCGEQYCIKKGDKSELIKEINIRLAGFGGNIPTDEFTDRTEKMIKQFQKHYMGVQETGKICGNVLKAIDEFQNKYIIAFDDVKCSCGKCDGFGNGKFSQQKQDSKIEELYRKYEYPGIHRSLIWALRAAMFYTTVIEKDLKYSVKCIFSGYRCDENNRQHKRTSTNHMGKALDIHFEKNKKRTQVPREIEEIRQKIYVKYLGNQVRWGKINQFSLEPGIPAYKGEFIASTWIHYDVRQFELKYLKDEFFAKDINYANGESIVAIAKKTNRNTCNCMGSGKTKKMNATAILATSLINNFTEIDAKEAIKIIYDKYGRDIAITIEQMYRDETRHFQSDQYKACGTGGMEAFGSSPYYGWDKNFFEENPQFRPIGIWKAYENKGMSGKGGNQQVTDRKKDFVILPSVLAGMEYKAFYIKKYNGNWARWHSTKESNQKVYEIYIKSIKPRFINEIENK